MGTLDFYQDMPDVNQAMFVDVEARLHVKAFEEASEAYVKEDYHQAIQLFENALNEWYEEFADCRALCEEPVDFGDKYKEELPTFQKYQVWTVVCDNFIRIWTLGRTYESNYRLSTKMYKTHGVT